MHEAMARSVSARAETGPELEDCIRLADRAARACMACADAFLAAADVAPLNRCLRLSLECADRCFEVAALSPRRSDTDRFVLDRLLATCAEASERCVIECRRHWSGLDACRLCAEACEDAAAACRVARAAVAVPSAQSVNF